MKKYIAGFIGIMVGMYLHSTISNPIHSLFLTPLIMSIFIASLIILLWKKRMKA